MVVVWQVGMMDAVSGCANGAVTAVSGEMDRVAVFELV